MKNVMMAILYVFFLLSGHSGYAQDKDDTEFRVVNDLQVNFNDVSGPGRSASSLTDGTNYIESLNLYTKGNQGDLNYIFNIGGRTTNDKQYDTAEFALTSLKGHFDYQDHAVDAGDIFESYSQYSLDSALKGTSYKFYNEADNLPNISMIYGVAYARWENMWDGYNLETLKREVMGMNITHDLNPISSLGFSVVHTDDSEPVSTSDDLFDNTVYALNFDYNPIPGLTIKAESALSDTTQDYSGRTHSGSYQGNANKLEIVGDGHPSRVALKYERVSPKFQTLVGSAVANQERFTSTWKYNYSKNTTTNLNFLWLRNNINDSAQMTHTWQPQASISVRKLFDRRYATTTMSYKLEKKAAKTLSTLNQYLTLTHTDRYGILENSTSIGLNSFYTDNSTRDQIDYTANTTFNSRHKAGDFILKPMLSLGTFFYENQLINQTNQVLQYSIGLGIDHPKNKIYSSITFGQNKLHAFGQDNSDRLFTRFHVYYKPEMVGFLQRSTFSLRGAINDYSFSTTTRDFLEKSISLGINIPFSTK